MSVIAVRPVCAKLCVEQIFIPMYLPSHLRPPLSPPDSRQQSMLLYNPQHSFGIAVYTLPPQLQTHSEAPAGTQAAVSAGFLPHFCLRTRIVPPPHAVFSLSLSLPLSRAQIFEHAHSRFFMTIPPDAVCYPASGGIFSPSVFICPVHKKSRRLFLKN